MNQLPGTPGKAGSGVTVSTQPARAHPQGTTQDPLSPQKTPPQGRRLPLIALLQDQSLVTWRGLHPPLLPINAFIQARKGGASVVKGFDQKLVKVLSRHSSETSSGMTETALLMKTAPWKEHGSMKAVCSGGPASQVPWTPIEGNLSTWFGWANSSGSQGQSSRPRTPRIHVA